MIQNRKLVNGEKDVEKFLDDCSASGIDVCELLWSQTRDAIAKIVGVEVPAITEDKSKPFATTVDFKVSWTKDGSVKFYPDARRRCWGYVALTDYNKDFLAKTIRDQRFRIVDEKIRKEIEEIAKARDYKIEPIQASDIAMSRTVKGDTRDKMIKELKEQVEKLKEQLPKPLSGVRISTK